jgi:hypothetical protein
MHRMDWRGVDLANMNKAFANRSNRQKSRMTCESMIDDDNIYSFTLCANDEQYASRCDCQHSNDEDDDAKLCACCVTNLLYTLSDMYCDVRVLPSFILRENIMLIHLFMQQFSDYFDV